MSDKKGADLTQEGRAVGSGPVEARQRQARWKGQARKAGVSQESTRVTEAKRRQERNRAHC